MKREFRLEDKDMLSPDHFPIQAVFNMVSDNRFIQMVSGISTGKGFGENYGACVFPDDLDEYDIATEGIFEGVEFCLHNGEEIIIDYQSFFYYFKKICNDYVLDFPQNKTQIEDSLMLFKQKFKILEN